MKPLSPFRKAVAAGILVCTALLAPASGLISEEAASVVHMNPGASAGARGKQLATLHSYLFTQSVTVGLDPNDSRDWKADTIARGIQVWSDCLTDNPFTLAASGTRPMIVVKFVDNINAQSGGDIQGQIEATRFLHWGTSVSYKIEGTLLVRRTTGRRDLRDDELTEVVAHELGHLLGLDDVDECIGLMGPFVPGRARMAPTKREVSAVVRYREQLRDAIAKLNR
jgi:hypothetical protein